MRPIRLRPREEAVLRLAAHGLDNEEIAERLGITKRTVTVHWQGVYSVLGLVGQTERRRRAIHWWRDRVP